MNINSVSPMSFKSYIPITYMAKSPDTGKYHQIVDESNIRKCQSFVVRNLNGTAKNNKNDKFVQFYKSYDRDYARCPVVHSIYDKDSPVVYMVTGEDTDVIREFAKPVGKAKGESVNATGRADSFESHIASRNYFANVKAFLKRSCKRVKAPDGTPLSMIVYFKPNYSRNNRFKGFEFTNVRLYKEEV